MSLGTPTSPHLPQSLQQLTLLGQCFNASTFPGYHFGRKAFAAILHIKWVNNQITSNIRIEHQSAHILQTADIPLDTKFYPRPVPLLGPAIFRSLHILRIYVTKSHQEVEKQSPNGDIASSWKTGHFEQTRSSNKMYVGQRSTWFNIPENCQSTSHNTLDIQWWTMMNSSWCTDYSSLVPSCWHALLSFCPFQLLIASSSTSKSAWNLSCKWAPSLADWLVLYSKEV